MKTYYQVTFELGGAGEVRGSFDAAIKDLRSSIRAARNGGDLQGIGLRKFTNRYSDYSDELPLTDEETAAVEAL